MFMIFYVYVNDQVFTFEDFSKAEDFAYENDGILSDAWGDPIC